MQLEELTKSQIVLLTLLVSFVTSIATGIVTVTLIEEAPTDVTRIIQRVVERTVETVTPAEQQTTVITRERTIIVKEADLIAAAVAQNKQHVVRVVNTEGDFIALGVIIDNEGTVATDASALNVEGTYEIDMGEEDALPATITNEGGARGIALLKIDGEVTTQGALPNDAPLQLGQTLVAFVGGSGKSIAMGIVSELVEAGQVLTSISTEQIVPGSVLINTDGDLVGISTGVSRELSKRAFVTARAIVALLAGAEEEPGPSEEGEDTATTTEEGAAEAATEE